MKLPSPRRARGFTLLELLTVMAIIVFLAGLVVAGMGHAQRKANESRARAEIAALSTALESYKADNGEYPNDSDTDGLNPSTATDPTAVGYTNASGTLFRALAGYVPDSGGSGSGYNRSKVYFEFKPTHLNNSTARPTTATASGFYIVDPYGNAYGYSTAGTYNPTFDLWSTGGETASSEDADGEKLKWITNWSAY